MEIVKEAQGGQKISPDKEDLSLINALTRRDMKEEELYLFSVRLCDNEIDRDGECFPRKTLEQLAVLFQGKTGLFDHSWSAKGQAARIYKTEIVEAPEVMTQSGERYSYLKACAYMMRTKENESLIAEIEGGIKKEVSVGCSVKRSVCSICGQDFEGCLHNKGEEYEGRLCFVKLEDATDAYEFSFVAVPAQPNAGVIKGKKRGAATLKDLAQRSASCRKELETLQRDAEMGRRYLKTLRKEVVRLGGLADEGSSPTMLKQMADKLDEQELIAMRNVYEKRAMERYPLKTQLEYGVGAEHQDDGDGVFLI